MEEGNVRFNLAAERLELAGDKEWATLTVHYNSAVSEKIDLKSEDQLYALRYLICRAIAKIEHEKLAKRKV